MTEHKSVQRIWQPVDSGLVVPEGTVSHLSVSSSQTYLHIKEKAIAVEHLFAESNVPLAPNSELAQFIGDARALSDAWLLGQADKLSLAVLLRGTFLDRIAAAVLSLRAVPERTKFLKALASGSLDLLQRKKSNAKDVLWELELWSILKHRSFDAVLEEPPDIVVNFDDSRIGIACKKLYSERHVQTVLSQAVAQLEPHFDFGMVALNLDDLVPPNRILKMPTYETMSEYINALNTRFLQAHERHFRKYLGSGRLISAYISTSVLADVYRAPHRLNNATQSTVWTIPGLPMERAQAWRRFYDRLMG